MTKKWIAINILLLLVAAALGWELRVSIQRFREGNDPARIQPRDVKTMASAQEAVAPLPSPKKYNAVDFDLIPAQNLFSQTRARDEKVEAPAVPDAPALNPKPLLVGITISGSQRLAAIVEPIGSPGSARKTQTKRLGDTYQGYTITDITDSAIVLEASNRREVIPLYDAAKRPAGGGKTPIVATRVVAIGSLGPAAGGGASAQPVVAAAPVQSRPGASPTIIQTSQQSAIVPGIQRPTPAVATAQPGAVRQIPGAAPQTPPNWNEATDAQGRRVIRTPFGDIVREKPPNP